LSGLIGSATATSAGLIFSASPSGTSSNAPASKSSTGAGFGFTFLTSTVLGVTSSSPLTSLSRSSRIFAASLGSNSSKASSAVFPYLRTMSASAIP